MMLFKKKAESKQTIGDNKLLSLKPGFNRNMQKFYIQITNRETEDITRIFLNKDELNGLRQNLQMLAGQHNNESK